MKTIRFIVISGIIAGLYVALTLAFAPISYGLVQFRVAEALTVLPFVFPPAIVGLTLGCAISNLFSFSPWDILIGSSATLLAALSTYLLSRSKLRASLYLAPLPAVLWNAIIVGLELTFLYHLPFVWWLNILSVGAGELVVCYFLGLPLLLSVRKIFKKVVFGGFGHNSF